MPPIGFSCGRGRAWDSFGTVFLDDRGVLYTAKCYWPGVTEDDLRDACDRPHQRDDAREGPAFRGLLYVRDSDTVLALFEAGSPASVKRAKSHTRRLASPPPRLAVPPAGASPSSGGHSGTLAQ